jgi:hypothetical protein
MTKKEKRLVLFGLLGWSLFLVLGISWLSFGGLGPGLLKRVQANWDPPRPKQSELSKPTQRAIAKYWKRGGKYVWGRNDCSVFVLDYLKARGAPVTYRMTTHSMSQPNQMAPLGYAPGEPTDAKEFIFVARYLNANREWRGHTGIGVFYKNHRWYVHNAANPGGLVIEDEKQFADRMKEVGISLDAMTYYPMPSLNEG